jgi:hypothetical protein
MGFRCLTCGATQADKSVCASPDCGFRLGRFVIEPDAKRARWELGGCAVLALLGLIVAVVVYTPSLNQGVVDFFARELDAVVRWWFGH